MNQEQNRGALMLLASLIVTAEQSNKTSISVQELRAIQDKLKRANGSNSNE